MRDLLSHLHHRPAAEALEIRPNHCQQAGLRLPGQPSSTYNLAVKLYPGYEWFITPHWLRRFGPLKLIRASLLDRVGLHFYTVYAALNGAVTGALTLVLFVLKKTLGAGGLEVGVLASLSVISLLLGIFGSELVEDQLRPPLLDRTFSLRRQGP